MRPTFMPTLTLTLTLITFAPACSKSQPPAATSAPATNAPATTPPATTPPATTPPATTASTPDVTAQPAGDQMSTTAPSDVAAPPADATTTASGLAWKALKKGAGEKPNEWDSVTVHYVGWTTDGKSFDSNIAPAQPISFPLKGVIAGWTEGVQLMGVGDRFRFWIPEKLAYQGQPGAPAGMLVFDVELLAIKAGKKPLPAPDDVAAPPADAQKTATGLAWKVLTPGKGGAHPTADSNVEVHYTGWTTDGKMFDSSVARGQTAKFPLKGVIAGWTEGLQLMEVGMKARLWIPEELAYKGRPGKPAGMLVFDVELIGIQ